MQPPLAYAVPPEKAATGYGAVLAFDVASAARYRIALGAAAWIDVIRAGAAQGSVAHAHGPGCSGIRKMVDFDLRPGPHLLQLSGSAGATMRVMVARLP